MLLMEFLARARFFRRLSNSRVEKARRTQEEALPASIFGDDWRGSPGIELVAEPGLHLVFGQMMPHEQRSSGGDEGREGGVGVTAEVGIAVFGAQRPIVGDGIFEAAADRPADTGFREAGGGAGRAGDGSRCVGIVVGDACEGDAAGSVQKYTVEGDTGAAANRTLNVGARANRESANRLEHTPAQAGAVDRAFE